MTTLPFSNTTERSFQLWNSDAETWLKNNVTLMADNLNATFISDVAASPTRMYRNLDGSFTLTGAAQITSLLDGSQVETLITGINDIFVEDMFDSQFNATVADAVTGEDVTGAVFIYDKSLGVIQLNGNPNSFTTDMAFYWQHTFYPTGS